MRIQCGDYTFISARKDSPYVQVLEGVSKLRTIKRTQAEGLFKSLRKRGYQFKDVTSITSDLNGAIPSRWM